MSTKANAAPTIKKQMLSLVEESGASRKSGDKKEREKKRVKKVAGKTEQLHHNFYTYPLIFLPSNGH
jgi:hypothetical protein